MFVQTLCCTSQDSIKVSYKGGCLKPLSKMSLKTLVLHFSRYVMHM